MTAGAAVLPLLASAALALLPGCAATVERMDSAGNVVERIRVPWPQTWEEDGRRIKPGDGTVDGLTTVGLAAAKYAPEMLERTVNVIATRAQEAEAAKR